MNITRRILSCVAAVSSALAFGAEIAPSWTLPAEKRGVELSACGVEIPETAIPEANAFTLEARLKFEKDSTPGKSVPIFSHESGKAGYKLWFVRYGDKRAGHGGIFFRCNGNTWEITRANLPAGTEVTFTLASKKGAVTVYRDGLVLKRFVMTPVPLVNPVLVGVPADPRGVWEGIKLMDARAYGADFEYWGKNETREPTVGFAGGQGWLVSVPGDESQPLPKLLYIGDSISMGYNVPLQKLLKGTGYGYHWIHFDGCSNDPVKKAYNVSREPYLAACSFRKYDVIVYNNGLHSLGWQEGYVDEKSVLDHYRSAVDVMREAAPQAKIVFLNTTPLFTVKKAGETQKIDPSAGRNGVVRYLNRLAGQVMKEKGVDVIDIYSELEGRADLIGGDGCHWAVGGSELIARRVFEKFRTLTAAKSGK